MYLGRRSLTIALHMHIFSYETDRRFGTVRGFGFATSCVEMFKQNTKQSSEEKGSSQAYISS